LYCDKEGYMGIFNRSFVVLMAVLWCAAMGAGIYLIWEQGKNIAADSDWLQLNFDLIFETQAERVLATLVAGALALPALLLLAMELVPQGSRGYTRGDQRRAQSYGSLETRVDELQKRLDEEQGRRRDAEKQVDRERGYANEEARRNADAVRATPAVTTERHEDREVHVSSNGRNEHRRRGWRLLPRRS
jgi:hypothetical protein